MVARVHNLDPTILPEGSAKLRWGGGGAGGKGQSSIDFIYFWGRIRSSDGLDNEPKKRYGRAREAKTH
jgi:hypothetical protein